MTIDKLPQNSWEEGKSSSKSWDGWKLVCQVTSMEYPQDVGKLFKIEVPVETVMQYHEATMNEIIPDFNTPNPWSPGKGATRSDLLNQADNLPTWVAISELLDNTFDAYLSHITEMQNKGETFEPLNIHFNVLGIEDQKNCSVIYKHNNGGFTKDQFEAFISYSHHKDSKHVSTPVGVWGKGQKLGMAKIGRANRIVTYVHDHEPNPWIIAQLGMADVEPDSNGGGDDSVKIKHPKNFYHPDNTCIQIPTFPPTSDENLPAKTNVTSITFKRITPGAFKDFQSKWPEIVNRIQRTYASKVDEVWRKTCELVCEGKKSKCNDCKPTVVFSHENHTDLPQEILPTTAAVVGEYIGDFELLETMFVRPPNLEPRRLKISFKDLTLDCLIGLLPDDEDRVFHGHKIGKGLAIWGNGRLFTDEHKDIMREKNWNYNDQHISNAPKYDDKETKQHWRCFIKITTEHPINIPWQEGTKWGYANEHRNLDDLRDIYFMICFPFWRASQQIKGGGHGTLLHRFVNVFRSNEYSATPEKLGPTPQDYEEYCELLHSVQQLSTDQVKHYVSAYLKNTRMSSSEVKNVAYHGKPTDLKKELNTHMLRLGTMLQFQRVHNRTIKTEGTNEQDFDYLSPNTIAAIVYPHAFFGDDYDEEE